MLPTLQLAHEKQQRTKKAVVSGRMHDAPWTALCEIPSILRKATLRWRT